MSSEEPKIATPEPELHEESAEEEEFEELQRIEAQKKAFEEQFAKFAASRLGESYAAAKQEQFQHFLEENPIPESGDEPEPPKGAYVFKNWGENLTIFTDKKTRYLKPKTRADIEKFLKQAYEAKKLEPKVHVRCNSHKHSYTEIFISDDNGFLIDFDPTYPPYFEKKRDFKVVNESFTDPQGQFGFLEIPVGKTSGKFGEWSLQNKNDDRYCLPQDMIAEYFTYPGVTTVGCHSSGFNETILSDYIVGLEIMYVTDDGTVVTKYFVDGKYYSDKKNHAANAAVVIVPHAEFANFRVNLGLFGVILTVTMKVRKTFYVTLDHKFPTLTEMFKNNYTQVDESFKDLVQKTYYAEFFWFPFSSWKSGQSLPVAIVDAVDAFAHYVTGIKSAHEQPLPAWDANEDKMYIKVMQLDNNPPQNSLLNDAKSMVFTAVTKLWSNLKTAVGAKFMQSFEKFDPTQTPWMLSAGFPIVEQDKHLNGKQVAWPNAIHYQYGIDYVPVRQMEVCFLIGKADNPNWEVVAKAFGAVVNYVQNSYSERQFPLDMCCESRFTRASSSTLANCYHEDAENQLAFYIEVVSRSTNHWWPEFAEKLGAAWRKIGEEHQVPCTFHWAKDIPKPNDAAYMKQWFEDRYGPRVAGFNEVREKYIGKNNLFANNWLRDLFNM